DGFYNTKVNIRTIADTAGNHTVDMRIGIDRGKKIKIRKINFEGNELFSDARLRATMKNTKRRNFFRFWKASKFIPEKYREDLTSVVDKYKEKGHRDARIISDTVIVNPNKNDLTINIRVEEGRKYYFGDIKFLGNSVYSDQTLQRML